MKKSLILTLSLAFAGLWLVSPVSACAGDETGETDDCIDPVLISPAGASADSEVYAEAGNTVQSNHYVDHSLFLAGNDVSSSDRVEGINFVAGNLVQLSGTSEYAALAGNAITVSGTIQRDLFAAGSSVELTDEAYIGRDIYAAAGVITVKTNLYGNAFLGGNRLVLEDITIDGDLNVAAEEIVIKGKVAVSGTFNYNDTAQITGLTNLTAGDIKTYVGSSSSSLSFSETLSEKILALLGGLLLTIVLIALMPKFSKQLLDTFQWNTAWKHLALGLGLLIFVPISAIFVAITIVGIPLGCMAIGLYFFFICIASHVTGGIVGDQLAKSVFKQPKMHTMLKYTIGTLVLFLLTLIPVVGELISAVSLCFGFGYLSKRLFVHK